MRLFPAAAAAFVCFAGAAGAAEHGPYAVVGFGGLLIDNVWEDVFLQPHEIAFESPGLVGVAASARVARPLDGLDLEVEGQLVRHFGLQTHWELNAPILTARWTRFPWDETVDTSAAYGLGLSFASEEPSQEARNEGDTEQVMPYWMIEVAAGPPEKGWEAVWRLHHRSTAFGAFGDDGGSNALVLGLRRRF